MAAERWMVISGWPGYEVSDFGRVRSWFYGSRYGSFRRKEPLVKDPQVDRKGYLRVQLTNGATSKKNFRIHRLVAEAFIGRPPDGSEVNHKNGDKADNHVGNLEYVTGSQNVQHAYDFCIRANPRGSRRFGAKLTESEVSQMKVQFALGKKIAAVAREFKISHSTASRIRHGRRWTHVT